MSLASGAHPTATFPCDHLAKGNTSVAGTSAGGQPLQDAKWAAPESSSPVSELRQAINDEDWANHFSANLTIAQVQASWAASVERCEILQCVAKLVKASRVLEIGSFCGVAAMALAEVVPEHGTIVSLEYDKFLADFGNRYLMKHESGQKVSTVVGLARESLENLAKTAADGKGEPFDMVVIDADKAGMRGYFDTVMNSPGVLSERGVVCVDVTPFKGQPPQRYIRFGQADQYKVESGQAEIDGLRAAVSASSEFTTNEFGGLLVIQRIASDRA
jgi:predicted O-methyltransferase YrrM